MESLPFDIYPGRGRVLLGHLGGDNARHGYGLRLQRKTGQTRCAYCGLSLVDSYEHWLMLSVDHVVPAKAGEAIGIPSEWLDDYCNKVLCCSACNGFGNGYALPASAQRPSSVEEFCRLRDDVFLQRRQIILTRHEKERDVFSRKPWETPLDR